MKDNQPAKSRTVLTLHFDILDMICIYLYK
jgi:hypothetical protein